MHKLVFNSFNNIGVFLLGFANGNAAIRTCKIAPVGPYHLFMAIDAPRVGAPLTKKHIMFMIIGFVTNITIHVTQTPRATYMFKIFKCHEKRILACGPFVAY